MEKETKQAKTFLREKAKWSEHARKQKPLKVGHMVAIQNLKGNHPLKWDRTGVVVEVLQFDQYRVKVDGSNRVTLRNRQNLRIIGFKDPQPPFPMTVPCDYTGRERRDDSRFLEKLVKDIENGIPELPIPIISIIIA